MHNYAVTDEGSSLLYCKAGVNSTLKMGVFTVATNSQQFWCPSLLILTVIVVSMGNAAIH